MCCLMIVISEDFCFSKQFIFTWITLSVLKCFYVKISPGITCAKRKYFNPCQRGGSFSALDKRGEKVLLRSRVGDSSGRILKPGECHLQTTNLQVLDVESIRWEQQMKQSSIFALD